MNAKEIALKNKIYEVVTGSHAYGTSLPTSDNDSRGIFILPRELTLSPFFSNL